MLKRTIEIVMAIAFLLGCATYAWGDTVTATLTNTDPVAGTVLTLPLNVTGPVGGTDDINVTFGGASFTSTAPVDIGLILYTSGDPCGGMANGWGTLTGQVSLRLGNGCGYTIQRDGTVTDPWLAVGLVDADATAPVYGMDFSITLPDEPGITVTSASFVIGFSGDGVITPAPDPVSTPEPWSLSLLCCGLGALLVRRRP